MSEKNYFQFYETFLQVIEALPIDEQLKYFKAICRYGLFNEKPQFEGKDLAIFLQIQFAIDNQNKRKSVYRLNGSRGGRPKTKDNQQKPNETKIKQNAELNRIEMKGIELNRNIGLESPCNSDESQNVLENNSIAESKTEKRKRFLPPTLEEVQAYCKERNNGINAESFVDFYTAKNWYVGRNKMKDWKASVRTWENNDFSKNRPIVQKVRETLNNKDFAEEYIDII